MPQEQPWGMADLKSAAGENLLGIRILQTRPVARLPCKPLKESLELRECRVQGRFAQLLPGLLCLLLGKMPFESDCLLKVKGLEIFVLGVDLKPV